MYANTIGGNATTQASRRGTRRALDTNASSVSVLRANARFTLRNKLRPITTVPRVCACGRALRGNSALVHLVRDVPDRAHYNGLETCRRVWICPVCSVRISFERAHELRAYIGAWTKRDGDVWFLTLTFPHDADDLLATSAALAAKAFTAILRGRAWGDDKRQFGIVGTVRALEVTLGENGWHPHLHVLLFLKRARGVRARRAFHSRVVTRFTQAVTRAGFREPDPRNCPLERVTTPDIGRYVAKATGAALEMTSWHFKKGRGSSRTPRQLLQDVVTTGRPRDRERYEEWERGMYGRRQLTYSKGLRKMLAAEVVANEQGTGADIASEANAMPYEVAGIHAELWDLMVDRDGVDQLVRRAYADGGYIAARDCIVEQLADVVIPAFVIARFRPLSGPALDEYECVQNN